jgi:acyl transferase domain-containing protein/pimeloyl-ACP methyl ester carboxylesterase/aryl carrier-like protein
VTSARNLDAAELMKRSLLELRKLRARVADLESGSKEPIALIGLGCRFPGGADDPAAFWKLLVEGRDAVVETPPNRWDVSAYYDPDPSAPGKTYVRDGGFLRQVEGFDAHFFGISSREATSLDPQQRMLLEVAWEALERAGQAPDRLYNSNAGVFVGISSFEYAAHLLRSVDAAQIDPYFGTGSALSAAAGRLSFTLGLTGPSMSVDTACSSSLVALHLACQSLRYRECDLALAGGVNLIVAPEVNIAFSKARLLAADGRCKTFDAAADGYVRGEGCGVVVLKRLSDALSNGDPIIVQIRGTAVNQDGPSGALVVPNGISQRAVIQKALENAGVNANEVDYVEAHGTGTSLGDPIEVGALAHVFGKDRDSNRPLFIGSVKTNLGHLESAAGIAGLIKVALALQHGIIPPNLHFLQPNPRIPWDLLSAVVPTKPTAWPQGAKRHLAGLSSFGFTGTNAHVVLEEAPVQTTAFSKLDRPVHVLTLSAKTDTALRELAGRFGDHLASEPGSSAADFCYSANTGRARFRERLAIVAGSTAEFREKLADFVGGRNPTGLFRGTSRTGAKDKTAFLFTGDGAEYQGMGRELYGTHHEFREILERSSRLLRKHLQGSLTEGLFPDNEVKGSVIDPAYARPALYALQVALARLWLSWGIRPAAIMGQGFGEYAAACCSGVFSFEDGLELVARLACARSDENLETGPFEEVLQTVKMSVPKFRFVSLSTGEAVDQQIASPEFWRGQGKQTAQVAEAFRTLHSMGCTRFIEVGPDSVLVRAGRDCLPQDSLTWIPSLTKGQSDWRQLADGLALVSTQEPAVDWSAFDRNFSRRKVVLPTYPFQRERFWLQASRPKGTERADELYYRIEWRLVPESHGSETMVPPARRNWLIFADEGAVGEELATRLRAAGEECILVAAGAGYQRSAPLQYTIDPEQPDQFCRLLRDLTENCQPLRGVVHLWGLDGEVSEQSTPDKLRAATLLGCGATLHLVQALAACEFLEPPRLWLVTRGAQPVGSEMNLPGVAQATLWGLGRVISAELPQLRCSLIDLDPSKNPLDVTPLFAQLWQSNPTEESLALRENQSYVSRLVPCPASKREPAAFKPERSYLITGGLGGIGLRIARWMAEAGARHLILLARHDPSELTSQGIEELRRLGTEVAVIRADISRPDDVSTALDRIRASMPPLAGVFHCAGMFGDRVVVQHRWDLFQEVLAPKVFGAWNLHTLTKGMDLDFLVLFSSAASLLPAPGMSSYVAANTFLDAFSRYRQNRGLPALSISWGPWENVGMAHRAGRSRENQWRAHGMQPLSPSKALEALGCLLKQKHGHLGVFSVNWQKLLELFSGLPVPSYLEMVATGMKPPADGKESKVFGKLKEMPVDERSRFLESHLKGHITRLLGPKARAISISDNLPEAGVDSLMIMDVLNALRDDLRFMLYPREFYEQPTIQGLARYLAAEFERAHGHPSGDAGEVQAGMSSSAAKSRIRSAIQTAAVNRIPADAAKERLPGIAFLLSSPRSGSTLLRVMLAGHPGLFSPPELHLLPFLTMGERSRHLKSTNLGEGLQRALMALLNLDADESRTTIEAWVDQNLPIHEVYATLQDRARPRLLVDKSPSYAASCEIMARAELLFEGAKYIHLVRHPYAVIESFVRMRMEKLLGAETLNPYFVAEEVWTAANRNILDALHATTIGRCHRVYYEELVHNPKAVLGGCCEFLGVPFHESVLKPYEPGRMTDGIYPVSAPIDDPNFLKHTDIDARLGDGWKHIDLGHRLNARTRALAQELGYELPLDQVHLAPNPAEPNAAQLRMAAPRQWEMEECFIETARGLRLCLCQWGPKAGSLVLLVHGILEQGASWCAVAEKLAEKGFRVVAPDLRGHGRSDHVGAGGSYHVLDFVADLDAIATKLDGKQFSLVGHSLGSVIAGLFSVARPDTATSLLLVESPLPSARQNDAELDREQLATQLDYLSAPARHSPIPDLEAAASKMIRGTPGLPRALALRLAERNTVAGRDGIEWRWDAMLRTRAGIAFGHEDSSRDRYIKLLQNLRVPLTIVYGTESNLQRDREWLFTDGILPGAEIVALPGGHNLHLEKPEALAEVIAKATLSAAGFPPWQEQITGT